MVDPIVHLPGEPHLARPTLGYVLVAIAATLFAVNGTVSKVILGSGISAEELTQVRCAGALVGLVLLAAATRRSPLRLRPRGPPLVTRRAAVGLAAAPGAYC